MIFSFFNKKQGKEEYYYGLVLKDNLGLFLCLKNQGGKLIIFDKISFNYSNGWDNLLEDVDAVVAKFDNMQGNLSNKLILFLYSNLIDIKKGEIKEPYFHLIKTMVKSLGFQTLGYIEVYEGVINYLEKKEEIPLTSILCELDANSLSVFIYKGGRKIFSKVVSRSGNVADNIADVLETRPENLILPSKITVYDASDLKNEVEKLINYRWKEGMFIQFPKVEIIKEADIINSLVEVFQEQILPRKQSITRGKEEVMGFLIGRDISKEKETSNKELPENNLKKKNWQFKTFFSSLKLSVSGFWLLIGGIIFLFSVLFVNEFYFHKAKINLLIPTTTVTEKISNLRLPVKISTRSGEFSQSLATTGHRYVGTKAKGEATVFNFLDSNEKLGRTDDFVYQGKIFQLSEPVLVKAAEIVMVDGKPIKKPGETRVELIAKEIGEDKNIKKGVKLSIAKKPLVDFFGLTESAFSGGSKKEVKTIAAADLSKLETLILEKIKTSGKTPSSDIHSQKNKLILSDLTETVLKNKVFSGEVGEESNLVKLKAKAIINSFSVDKNLLIRKMEDKLNKDYGQKKEFIIVEFKCKPVEKKVKEDSLLVNVDYKARLSERINKKAIISKLRFKNKEEIGKILSSEVNIKGFELNIDSKLPFLGERTPLLIKNISLDSKPFLDSL